MTLCDNCRKLTCCKLNISLNSDGISDDAESYDICPTCYENLKANVRELMEKKAKQSSKLVCEGEIE